MLKILQARLQQYVTHELPDIQAVFGKGRGTRDQIANICWIIEKASKFQKNIYFCFIDYAKAFDCMDPINCGNSGGSVVKNLPASAGGTGLIPDLGRSPGKGNGSPLQ